MGGGKEATPGPATPLTGLTHTPNIFFGYPPNFLPSSSIAPSQAPLEYQMPSTPTPIPKSPLASRLCGPPSSPAIGIPGVGQDELLDDFFEWYIQKYGGAGTRLEKIKGAQRVLKEDFEEVAGIAR